LYDASFTSNRSCSMRWRNHNPCQRKYYFPIYPYKILRRLHCNRHSSRHYTSCTHGPGLHIPSALPSPLQASHITNRRNPDDYKSKPADTPDPTNFSVVPTCPACWQVRLLFVEGSLKVRSRFVQDSSFVRSGFVFRSFMAGIQKRHSAGKAMFRSYPDFLHQFPALACR
jgi:hypothetical protein